MYRLLFTHVLRRIDPEQAHHLGSLAIRTVAAVPGLRDLVRRRCVSPASASPEGFRRPVHGPFGLAAGFDKAAAGIRGLAMIGFGFVEIGTVTAQAQPGNPRPRLWRVLDQRGVRNRMGFNNPGAAAVEARLRRVRATRWGQDVVIGVNIGKTKVTPASEAAEDYAASAGLLAPFADYLVVNVSSPNTPGLRSLQAVDQLRPILVAVRKAADAATPRGRRVPLLVKIAPDLAEADIEAIADLVLELGLEGVVAVNTTVEHDLGEGGLSGPPLLPRGVEVVRRLRARLGATPVLIGGGGITTAQDAREYLAAGADLVQGYTGFIYEGPFWAASINRELSRAGGRR